MALDWLMDAVAGALDGWLARLPGFSGDWPLVSALRTVAEYLALAWELLPPIRTALLVVGAYVAVELALIAFYWIMWLVKKIPGIS